MRSGPATDFNPRRRFAIADRVALIDALLAAGVTSIEAVAFVSPSAVPAMAGAAEVLAEIGRRDGVVMTALVPNPGVPRWLRRLVSSTN